MRRVPVLAGLAVVLAGGACATRGIAPIDLPAREIAGHYTGGAGVSWFRPCAPVAGDTLWWATFLGSAVAERDSLVAAGRLPAGSASYLRVLGAPSEPQTAGAEGRGSRFLYVRAVLETRAARAGDCTSAGGQ